MVVPSGLNTIVEVIAGDVMPTSLGNDDCSCIANAVDANADDCSCVANADDCPFADADVAG